jgi:glycerol-3-phosphate acyltransferase PlsY
MPVQGSDLARGLTAVLAAYLLGSLPFSHIITRWRTGADIRAVGIGNPGARNVWHVVGPWWGVLVGVLDAAKGFAAVLLARELTDLPLAALLAGPVSVLGHDFSVFLRFRGGKGLGTTVGVLLAWTPEPMIAGMFVCAVVQLMIRNLDRSVIPGAAVTVFTPPLFGYHWAMMAYALGLFLMLWLRKVQDRAHQRRVWLSSGWDGATHSDWYGERGQPDQGSGGSGGRGAIG